MLAELQEKYEGELDALVDQAYGDYLKYRNDRKKLFSLVPFYIKAGAALEREADADFNALVGDIEKELRANGLPLNMASDLRRQYRDLKQQKRLQLLDKAKKIVDIE